MKQNRWFKVGFWLLSLVFGMVNLVAFPLQLAGSVAAQSSGPPDQIHLAWVDDPATTMTAVWHTHFITTTSELRFRPAGQTAWTTVTGALRPSGTTGTLHEVHLTALTPGSTYEYQVRGDNATWSAVYNFRTAPSSGPSAFEAIYVADTGLVGRTDGLATGTQQVVDEIAAFKPLVILPGGDYAYYNTEGDRFPTLNGAIDAWFNQMQPAAAHSPMMPTYGNHEVLLGENVEDWLARFPTPDGFDDRRFYSFDIADVHFISIYAPHQITDTLALDWIEQDIIAAQAAGQKWIIPYFHVAPFADGTNHSSSQSLRNKLGPIFEAHNVPLVIASHDQAYERTWPLADAAGAATPTTTTQRACVSDNEGVTWIKVSPGGKLSNISWGFSPWGSDPAPGWTSVRSHSLHQFARLKFDSAGALTVEIYGVIGDGSTPVLIDSFTLSDSCPEQLLLSEPVQDFALFADEAADFAVEVTHSDSTPIAYNISSGSPWLIPLSATGTTTGTTSFAIDPGGLAPGTYAANVTFTPISTSTLPAQLVATLTVRGNSDIFQLYFADSYNRTNQQLLHDTVHYGALYGLTAPDTSDIAQVRFLIDDQKIRREKQAPYDLGGTTEDRADPFDTATLTEGEHVLTAVIVMQDGTVETAAARFRSYNQPVAITTSRTDAFFLPNRWATAVFLILGTISTLFITLANRQRR